jgi:L-threonylcarbamoyladenylate synthase
MKVDPQRPDDRAMVLAAEVLQAGGVVVYPTETLYGLGANAWNNAAVRRVLELKRRPAGKPVLVIVPSVESIRGLVANFGPAARALTDNFWPGPLTLVFQASQDVSEELLQGGSTIGVRIPSTPLCRRLTELSGYPITSTSANISGQPVGSGVDDIEAALGPGVDLYLDAGRLPPSLASSIVDVSESPPRLLREGAISFDQLRSVVTDIVR